MGFSHRRPLSRSLILMLTLSVLVACGGKQTTDREVLTESVPRESQSAKDALPVDLEILCAVSEFSSNDIVRVDVSVGAGMELARAGLRLIATGEIELLDDSEFSLGDLAAGGRGAVSLRVRIGEGGEGMLRAELLAAGGNSEPSLVRAVELYFAFDEIAGTAKQGSATAARRALLDSHLASGRMSAAEYERRLDGLRTIVAPASAVKKNIPLTTNRGEGPRDQITIDGTIRYHDSAGNPHPVRLAPYQYYREAGAVDVLLGGGNTSATGTYSVNIDVTIPGGSNIYLKVYARSAGIDIVNPGDRNVPPGSMTKTLAAQTVVLPNVDASRTVDFTIPNTHDVFNSFSVLDALTTSAMYMQQLTGTMPALIPSEFPGAGNASFFSTNPDNHMFILKLDRYDWDVINHEYAHYVAHLYDLDDSPGGSHSSLNNLAEDAGRNKDTGTRLAWGEGLATFLGIMTQKEMGVAAFGIPRAGDTFYEDTEDANLRYNLENDGAGRPDIGEDNEATVMRCLWDAYDGNSDGEDKISLGDDVLWAWLDLITPKTLSDAWNIFILGETTTTKTKYGGNFGEHNVAPEQKTPGDLISLNDFFDDPTLTWDANGAGPSNRLDHFYITFYKPDLETLIYQTPEVEVPTYTLSEAELITIFDDDDDVWWIVWGYNDNEGITTGIYCSKARGIVGSLAAICYILDRSGSMGGAPLANAKAAANQGITIMDLGSKVGVVSFSSGAGVNYGLQTITDDAIRAAARNAVNGLGASGSTSIGAGLLAAYNELVTESNALIRDYVLLTDGDENTSPYVADVIHLFLNLNPREYAVHRIHTIAYGSGANQQQMAELAASTGGVFLNVQGQNDPLELAGVFNTIQNEISGEQIIANEEGVIAQGGENTHTFFVDSSISEQTVTLIWSNLGDMLHLELDLPDGRTVTPGNWNTWPDVMRVTGPGIEYYTIVDDPPIGEWSIRVIADVAGGASEYGLVYSAQSTIGLTLAFDQAEYFVGQPVIVLAELDEDGDPILNATVGAEVELPGSFTTVTVEFHDDGAHGDGEADDGVYGGLFFNSQTAGSYNIDLAASGLSQDGSPFLRQTLRSFFIQDASAQPVTTAILQNPAVSQYADIVVVSDDPLMAAPIVEVEPAADPGAVLMPEMNLIPGADQAYSGEIELDQEGLYFIRTEVTPTGGATQIFFRAFGVTIVPRSEAAVVLAPRGEARIEIPENVVEGRTHFLAETRRDDSTRETTYRFGPAREFAGEMTIVIRYDEETYPEPDRLAVFRATTAGWRALPSRVLPGEREVRATITRLGEFKLAPREDEGESPVVPARHELAQNYPNPFNPSTEIRYALPEDGRVEITIYDAGGRRVRSIFAGFRPAGRHVATWNGLDESGRAVGSGVYFCRLSTSDFEQTRKMTLLR